MKQQIPWLQASPESVGLPSSAITAFLHKLEDEGLCMHSVLMVRQGRLISEVYWQPFDQDTNHRMYSVSKSFVSIAIGLLIEEGKLRLDDRIGQFFPDKIPDGCHPWILQTTVRDLLMMAAPHRVNTYSDRDPDWADTFFQTAPNHQPGRIFSYNTTATVMLLIILRRITGVEFIDYLRPRLFEPAGFSTDIQCIESPCGHAWGGSGVLCTPRDFARFALICLNGGRFQGKQLLPEDYVRSATSRQIDNSVENGDAEMQFGYGYQFWRTRHNGFACVGMGGQLAICLPDQDFVLVTTADVQAMSGGLGTVFRALWTEIYPHLAAGPATRDDMTAARPAVAALPENPIAQAELAARTSGLSLLTVKGQKSSPMVSRVSGKTYRLAENEMGICRLGFTFDLSDERGEMIYENATGSHRLRFGFGHQERQLFPETHYYGRRIGTPLGRGYDCHTSAAWVMEQSLLIICYLTDDYFGTLRINVAFDERGDTVTVLMRKNAEWFLDTYDGFADGVCCEP